MEGAGVAVVNEVENEEVVLLLSSFTELIGTGVVNLLVNAPLVVPETVCPPVKSNTGLLLMLSGAPASHVMPSNVTYPELHEQSVMLRLPAAESELAGQSTQVVRVI